MSLSKSHKYKECTPKNISKQLKITLVNMSDIKVNKEGKFTTKRKYGKNRRQVFKFELDKN